VTRANAIYGSFAALPLFLMWVQISWWIVLFGAELSFASQNVNTYEYEPDSLKISPAFKKLLSLQVAHELIHNFKDGKAPLTDSQISERLDIPIRLMHRILDELVATGLFVETRTNADKQFGYQPARDIKGLSIRSILEALEHNGVDNIPVANTKELEVLSDSLKQFSEAMESSPANRLLKDI
jgi:membrane protein